MANAVEPPPKPRRDVAERSRRNAMTAPSLMASILQATQLRLQERP